MFKSLSTELGGVCLTQIIVSKKKMEKIMKSVVFSYLSEMHTQISCPNYFWRG